MFWTHLCTIGPSASVSEGGGSRVAAGVGVALAGVGALPLGLDAGVGEDEGRAPASAAFLAGPGAGWASENFRLVPAIPGLLTVAGVFVTDVEVVVGSDCAGLDGTAAGEDKEEEEEEVAKGSGGFPFGA